MYLVDLFIIVTTAIVGYMTIWFLLAYVLNRADLIDTAWGLGFVFMAWLGWLLIGGSLDMKLIAVGFSSVWGLRLAAHILNRNIRKKEDDHRYQVYREQWGKHFWTIAYFKLFLLQGLLIVIISSTVLSILVAPTAQPRDTIMAILGFAIWGFGILFEAEADAQLAGFVKHKKPGEIMTRGLWKYSRHPNYFGEVSTWIGAAIVGLSYGQWWSIIGAAIITLLITKVSGVPLLEKHYADNKAFQQYAKHTSILIPLPPKP